MPSLKLILWLQHVRATDPEQDDLRTSNILLFTNFLLLFMGLQLKGIEARHSQEASSFKWQPTYYLQDWGTLKNVNCLAFM